MKRRASPIWNGKVRFPGVSDGGHRVAIGGPPERLVNVLTRGRGNVRHRVIGLTARKYRSASPMLERAGVTIGHDYELIGI